MKRTWLIVVSLLLTLACDGDKPSPTPTPIIAPTTVVSVSLSPVVQRIPPGETVQLTATARSNDGSTSDATSQAVWTSSQTNVARVAAGLVTGVGLGVTVIRASVGGTSASLAIIVEPDGTFILRGSVTEPGQLGVAGATVEVISGPANSVLTSFFGSYELFGVGGTSVVRMRKSGYFDESRTVTMSGDQTLNVEITPRVAPANVAGNYSVTFEASPSCTILSPELRTRTYTARIDQNAASLLITLSGAQFVTAFGALRNSFSARIAGDSVTADLGGTYSVFYYGPTIEESLPNGQTLGIWGTITASVTSQSISGTLVGGFALKTGNRYATCSAPQNQVVFTR